MDFLYQFNIGLSPPTRGNQSQLPAQDSLPRSIPAHAGEPPGAGRPQPAIPVYPRPRGGTTYSLNNGAAESGLSPPTRGNLEGSGVLPVPPGSIPAHAGEPFMHPVPENKPRVYPRPRGGTAPFVLIVAGGVGPIPAHAGEPSASGSLCPCPTVYPRPRGGTLTTDSGKLGEMGLSPPTRGNLGSMVPGCHSVGSIPAHAGEPTGHSM